jgi:hypothetical protein
MSHCVWRAYNDLIITISKKSNYKQLYLYLFIQDDSAGTAFSFTHQYFLLSTGGYFCKHLVKTCEPVKKKAFRFFNVWKFLNMPRCS